MDREGANAMASVVGVALDAMNHTRDTSLRVEHARPHADISARASCVIPGGGRGPVELDFEINVFPGLARIAGYLGYPG